MKAMILFGFFATYARRSILHHMLSEVIGLDCYVFLFGLISSIPSLGSKTVLGRERGKERSLICRTILAISFSLFRVG